MDALFGLAASINLFVGQNRANSDSHPETKRDPGTEHRGGSVREVVHGWGLGLTVYTLGVRGWVRQYPFQEGVWLFRELQIIEAEKA